MICLHDYFNVIKNAAKIKWLNGKIKNFQLLPC